MPGRVLAAPWRAVQSCWSPWAIPDQPGALLAGTGVLNGCTMESPKLTVVTISA